MVSGCGESRGPQARGGKGGGQKWILLAWKTRGVVKTYLYQCFWSKLKARRWAFSLGLFPLHGRWYMVHSLTSCFLVMMELMGRSAARTRVTPAFSYASILFLYVLLDCFTTSTRLYSAYADILILSRPSSISYFPLSFSFPMLALPLFSGVTSNDSCTYESILYWFSWFLLLLTCYDTAHSVTHFHDH